MEKILEIRNLYKSLSGRPIINNVSFDVYAGEVFGFIGPNGAGKTTTIKMVMGFLEEDSGQIIINGVDHKKDYEKAIKWYSQAADKGKLEAMSTLGHIYDFGGYGVERNIQKKFLWNKKEFEGYLKHANEGNVESQRKIGVFYEYGHGVEKDLKEAIKWYERASSKGDGIAGECLERIVTTNEDFETTKML